MSFYTGTEIKEGALIGHRGEEEYKILDDADVLEFFAAHSNKPANEFAQAYLSNTKFFGQDLTKIEGLTEAVSSALEEIRTKGMKVALENIIK